MSPMNGNGRTDTVINRRIEELRTVIYEAEPGSIEPRSDTLLLLEFYLHWLPKRHQKRWLDKHGEALKRAVFG